MRRLLTYLLLLCLTLPSVAQSRQKIEAPVADKTRVLLILDCSNSMWDRWQSDAKIKVTQKVLLKFLDSVANQNNIEMGMRVFGHLNKKAYGTRLEVPFAPDNNYQIQSKIKTLVPQGGCTISTALESSLNDFPATGASRNIILIITDGMDDSDGSICNVARRVQMSGVIVQTFILGIGNPENFRNRLDCAGKFSYIPYEEQYTQALYDIFRLSEEEASVVINMRDEEGHLYETETPVAFYDNQTHVVKYTTVYSIDERYTPDTMVIDPLVAYDIVLFTKPAITINKHLFEPDKANTLNVTVEQGMLRVRHEERRSMMTVPNYPVIVHQHGKSEVLNIQHIGEQVAYLAGDYDIEVLSTPVLKMSNVNIQRSSNTDLTIPMPGTANVQKPKNISTGCVFALEEGVLSWVCNLNPNKTTERLILMPGEYQLVLKPQSTTKYTESTVKRFQVEAGETTNIIF
jgi:hypothetical protein